MPRGADARESSTADVLRRATVAFLLRDMQSWQQDGGFVEQGQEVHVDCLEKFLLSWITSCRLVCYLDRRFVIY